MPKLADILASLLNDVHKARVNADMLTREAAQRYLEDQVLRLLPVPRVDFRGVMIALSFAVEAIHEETPNWKETVRGIAMRNLEEVTSRILGAKVTVQDPETSAEMQVPIRKLLGDAGVEDFVKSIRYEASRLLDLYLPKLENDLPGFVNSFWKNLYSRYFVGIRDSPNLAIKDDERHQMMAIVQQYANRVAEDGKEIIAKTEKIQDLSLEVIVEREKLVEIPEAAISKINLEIGVENFEWVTGETLEGVVEYKLVPR